MTKEYLGKRVYRITLKNSIEYRGKKVYRITYNVYREENKNKFTPTLILPPQWGGDSLRYPCPVGRKYKIELSVFSFEPPPLEGEGQGEGDESFSLIISNTP